MTKANVSEQKLVNCIVIPKDEERSFKQWWNKTAPDEVVTVQVPHAEHGLARKRLNNAKTTIADVGYYVVCQFSQSNNFLTT